MLWGYCGPLGSGKTTGLVAHLNDFKNIDGYTEFKTHGIALDFSKQLNIDEILNFELENTILGLSEAYTILDSRVNSTAERNIGYFMLQSRKRDVHVVYDAQLMSSIDKRLRYITDKVIFCERDWDEEWKKNEKTGILEPIIFGFYYHVFDKGEYYTGVSKYISFEKAMTDVFPLFDTKKIVMPMGVQNPNLTLEQVLEIFEDCKTKDSFVSLFHREQNFISLADCKAVYDLMKNNKYERVSKLLRIKNPLQARGLA